MAFGGKDTYPVHSGSSSSYVDGVQIRLGDQFRPPPKIMLPMNYQLGNPADVLFMEYDFSLEEGVIEWTDRKRKQLAAEEQGKIDKMAEGIETFAQSQTDESEETAGLSDDHSSAAASRLQADSGASADPAVEPSHPPTQTNSQAQSAVPFYHGLSSGGILMPTPIVSADKGKEAKKATPAFNIADFEREQDPFENVELKVLNDMEELDKVLQASSISASNDATQGQQTTGSDNVNKQDVSKPATSVPTSACTAQPYVPMSTPVQAQPSCQPAAFPNGITSLKHVDYPDIDSMSNTNTNANGPFSQLGTSPRRSGAAEQIQFTQFGAHFSKAQSPHMNYSTHTTQNVSQNLQGGIGLPAAGVGYPSQDQKGVNDMAKAFQEFMGQQRQSHNQSPNGLVHNVTKPEDYGNAARAWSPPPTMNQLRSARSVPDLAAMDQRPSSAHASAVTGSPKSLRSRTQTPPPRPSSGQDWNPYKPLPLTSNGWGNQASSRKSDQGSIKSSPGSRPTTPVKHDALPNCFNSLSPEAKRFAENITDMGFPRARVARAVEKLGLDDKKVLDHLCAVNRMVEKGFHADDSESALHLFKQKETKTAKYLQLVKQFRELGFKEEDIKNALLSCDLDENKALDSLFAS